MQGKTEKFKERVKYNASLYSDEKPDFKVNLVHVHALPRTYVNPVSVS